MTNDTQALSNPFDRPEISKLFGLLMDKLLAESGRGAVLIGTAYVDEQLTDFIQAIMPMQTKKYRERLLGYPGPLSSFSAKIELLYAFRYIGEPFYNSLNALRRIRNEAAHSAKEFSFVQLKAQFEEIFAFVSPAVFIRNEALGMMIKMKVDSLEAMFDEHQVDHAERKKRAQEILANKDLLRKLEEEQLPHWQLILGLSLLCGFLAMKKEETLKLLGNKKSWGDQ